ncbi:lytic transglycosylase domain-containing protein [Streptomyces venezuelae]|uniref:lytic transglycosylase domain-containing protein n=1 Tax=Streptomyces venezuelae TaxID=54571 RepID=UPI001CC24514|nr:lytic transglycosylase domain-containing protein [Streptomyces venezuelae]
MLCTAALAASLTTAAVVTTTPTADAGESEPTPDSPQANDRGNARLDLPDLVANPPVQGTGSGPGPGTAEGSSGIPATALDAYRRAEASVEAALPNCKLPWQLLAGIGRVESVHASGYGLKADGYTDKPIRGPRLDGNGFAEIRDTDKGEWDGDNIYDRAIGPMQFIPSTWARWGADGSGDGKRDPNNIYDAALGAGLYLCAGDRNLSNAGHLDKAILSYNNSREYVNTVTSWMRQYQGGATGVPNPPAGNYPTQPPTQPIPTPVPPVTPITPPAVVPPAKPAPKPNPKPTTPPTKPTTPPTKPPVKPTPPPATVSGLEVVGERVLAFEPGQTVEPASKVKAVLGNGKPAAREVVIFEIENDTTAGTVFADNKSKKHQVVKTDAQGLAAIPRIKVADGAKGGTFTVRATLYGTRVFTEKFDAKVTPKPVADKITRTDEKPLKVVAGSSFTPQELLVTGADGKPFAGVALKAGMVEKNEQGEWVPVAADDTTGPFFKDEDGKPVRTLELPATDANGKVTLPWIYTVGIEPGTYHLRLATPEGVERILDLVVEKAPETTPEPPKS